MHDGGWFLALPTYFLVAPEGLVVHLILLGCLAVAAIKKCPGWSSYIPRALGPIGSQIVILSILGALNGRANGLLLDTIIAGMAALSIYLIYQSFIGSPRMLLRVLVTCCQVYSTALACFIGLMSVNNSWL